MKQKMTREIRMKVPEDLYEALKFKSEEELKTVSAVIRDLILQYLKNKE